MAGASLKFSLPASASRTLRLQTCISLSISVGLLYVKQNLLYANLSASVLREGPVSFVWLIGQILHGSASIRSFS